MKKTAKKWPSKAERLTKQISHKNKEMYKYVTVRQERKCNKCGGVIVKKTTVIYWIGVNDNYAYTHLYCMNKKEKGSV